MGWIWKLGSFRGIKVNVHASFLLFLVWLAVRAAGQGETTAGIAGSILFVVALFGCVVLHEFGHALTAQHYGIRTRSITLLPIGGVASLERMPEEPVQELWVALAGPAVNIVIAAVLACWFLLAWPNDHLGRIAMQGESLGARLMTVNLSLAIFNLLPAFPMDGGRILRAFLATRMEYTKATQIAAAVGQGGALMLGFLGLWANPMLVFIALFVWIGASQEASAVLMKSALAGIPVSDAMMIDFHSLAPEDSLQRASEEVIARAQRDFPVVEDGRLTGVLAESDLLHALEKGGGGSVGEIMRRGIQPVDAREMLEAALPRLAEQQQCRTLPVVRDGRLVGLLTTDTVADFLLLHGAAAAHSHRM
jgi:Zn-dependent protease/CBS domain-containing protein